MIVIDPGHGGRDPGALGSFSKEKNINLAIALKTGEYIEKNLENVKVIYTRKDDSTVDLIERPAIANRNNADLFISIHSNATKVSKTLSGAETYIMGLTSNQENLEVAMKENEVMLLEDDYSTKYQGFDPKSPESYIIFYTYTKCLSETESLILHGRSRLSLLKKLTGRTGELNRPDSGCYTTPQCRACLLKQDLSQIRLRRDILIQKQGRNILPQQYSEHAGIILMKLITGAVSL